MCGLIAMHTTEKLGFLTADKDEFKQMLIVNSLRGAHSTGVAGVASQKEGKVNIVKSMYNPYSLFSYTQTDTFFARMVAEFTTIIGHGRYATRGAVNAINAHPFVEDHITLAHNGVINNFYSLKNYTTHKHIEVDSHLIAKLIAEEGAENILPRVEGAYVFIWYDDRDQTLNIARNAARPLYGIKQKNRNTLTFASEVETLIWNGERNNTLYDDPFEIPIHQIHTYHADSIEPVITEYTPTPPKPVHHVRNPKYDIYGDGDDYSLLIPANKDFKNKRKHHQEATTQDLSTLHLVEKQISLELGTNILFTLDDYEASKGYILVSGYSETYPNILFRASFQNGVTEDDVFEADFVDGTVMSIFPNTKPNSRYAWQVFLGNAVLHKDIEEPDDDSRVTMFNVMGHTESVTQYRLKEMAHDGCSWCNGIITERELKSPDKLLLFDINGNRQELVCPECAAGTLKTIVKKH